MVVQLIHLVISNRAWHKLNVFEEGPESHQKLLLKENLDYIVGLFHAVNVRTFGQLFVIENITGFWKWSELLIMKRMFQEES